jgi:hypothetical protein
MPVGNLLEHIHAKPLPEFHYALLVAGWTEAVFPTHQALTQFAENGDNNIYDSF